jgi:amino-acid N-acetyltransferase
MILRKATFRDVETIFALVNDYATKGLMLPRSRNVIYETLRDVTLVEIDGVVAGVGGLHIIWNELAEIRALAVVPELAGKGIGSLLVDKLTEEARDLGVKTLFTLTYQPIFFAKQGFTEVPKEKLPHKVWKDCINCSKFPNCDETALIKEL